MVNGKNKKDKAMENLSGQMDLFMLDIGIMIWLMVKVLYGIQMGRSILEIGQMINNMVKVPMSMQLVRSIMDNGIKINSMD